MRWTPGSVVTLGPLSAVKGRIICKFQQISGQKVLCEVPQVGPQNARIHVILSGEGRGGLSRSPGSTIAFHMSAATPVRVKLNPVSMLPTTMLSSNSPNSTCPRGATARSPRAAPERSTASCSGRFFRQSSGGTRRHPRSNFFETGFQVVTSGSFQGKHRCPGCPSQYPGPRKRFASVPRQVSNPHRTSRARDPGGPGRSDRL